MLAHNVEVGGRGRAVCDIVTVQFDKGRVELIDDRGVNGVEEWDRRRLRVLESITHVDIVGAHHDDGRCRMIQRTALRLGWEDGG